jgi:hypothetical protein
MAGGLLVACGAEGSWQIYFSLFSNTKLMVVSIFLSWLSSAIRKS